MLNTLIKHALDGQRRAIARLITFAETEESEFFNTVLPVIYPYTGRAHRIGITGPPGSGKSTLVSALARSFRQQGKTVAIIAVDPTSPFTGGAILGDRVRMSDLSGDSGVFIRSLASRGNLGGLARATENVANILDAVQFDLILIETVGAGQTEVAIANAAHTVVVVELPGLGDEIQAIKAGILEIADILVVNKADMPDKDRTVKVLRTMLQLGHPTRPCGQGIKGENGDSAESLFWLPPVCETIASTGQGIDALCQEIEKHKSYLVDSAEWQSRILEQCQQTFEQYLVTQFLTHFYQTHDSAELALLRQKIADRQLDPYTASKQLLQSYT